MRRTFTAATLALVLALPTAESRSQAKKTAPGWLSSFDQAKTQARQSGKPIFLVFR